MKPLRRERLNLLAAAIPAGAAVWLLTRGVGSFSDRPAVVIALLVPFAVAAAILGRPLFRERRLLLGGGFLWFFIAWYCLFAIALGTRLLEGRRAVIVGLEDATPSNLLGLNRLGDWRYRIAPRAPPALDIAVITLPSFEGQPATESRRAMAGLIANAIAQNAKGIAFDYVLAQESAFDGALCFWIERARAAGIPVVFAALLELREGVWIRAPLPPALSACVSDAQFGSAIGVREADGRVRYVLRSRPDDPSAPSFTARVAAGLGAPAVEPRATPLIRFVAPRDGPVALDGLPGADDQALLRDRFILVGSNRPDDVHATPYGETPGVMIHAWAAHGLRTGHGIRPLPDAWMFVLLFVLCYVITVVQASGVGPGMLAVSAALLIAALFGGAALGIRFGLLWIDAGVPALATGALAFVLAGGAALQQGRARARAVTTARPGSTEHGGVAAEPTPAQPFDVFVSYNAEDREAVLSLAEVLKTRRLRVWLDVWELVPGRPWQDAIEEVIGAVRSAVIVIGPHGLGPWEVPEMRACLEQCVARRMPVIPVLLPGAAEEPRLPLFLRGLTWVDQRGGATRATLDRIEWGITGIKP
ncbi:MAG: TIR domain-containing protein [Gemmatimonadetes bacterium]|nr:TIR domain-containing protein [Gemmatimonadota bacterium]